MRANLSITNTLYYIAECVSDGIIAFNDYDNFRDNFNQPVTSLVMVKVNIITLSEGTQTLTSFLTLIYDYKLKLQSQSGAYRPP